ncbi:MAG TPA: hypothetical protein VGB38_01220, partial [bacterium]
KGVENFRNHSMLPVFLLGLSAIGVELGFLYAYRTGWKFSTTAISTGAVTTGLLAFIGVVWFKEGLTWLDGIGIAFCTIGVVCINIR